jgi:hypothetical protein
MNQPSELVERYVALWNEPNPDARRAAIHGLWAEDAKHILQPPQEMRDAAAAIGFPAPTLEARGHDELEARVARAHDEFVAAGGFRFRPRAGAARVGDAVMFGWEMVPAGGEEALAAGRDVLVLDARGRIRVDYQFIER